jgi:hypothetical protein
VFAVNGFLGVSGFAREQRVWRRLRGSCERSTLVSEGRECSPPELRKRSHEEFVFEAAVARGVRCRDAYAVWLADVRMKDPCGYQNQSIESVSDTVRTNSSTEIRKGLFCHLY